MRLGEHSAVGTAKRRVGRLGLSMLTVVALVVVAACQAPQATGPVASGGKPRLRLATVQGRVVVENDSIPGLTAPAVSPPTSGGSSCSAPPGTPRQKWRTAGGNWGT